MRHAAIAICTAALLLAACRDQVNALSERLDCGNLCNRNKAVKALERPACSRLLLRALQDRDVRIRKQAARSLAGFDQPGVADGLIAALGDGDWQVRREAVRRFPPR